MAQGAHKITEQFENEVSRYTGAPYVVAVDNCSNALFLALYYELHVKTTGNAKFLDNGKELKQIIQVPCNTYPSVACEVIHAGARCEFWGNDHFGVPSVLSKDGYLYGSYRLMPTNVWDSALSFTHNMYKKGQHMCISFTGPYKHLKLGKGGAILTDDKAAAEWFKRARFSGRQECSYHNDNFDQEQFIDLLNEGKKVNVPSVAGWNFYMMPEIAARGILLMQQFYDACGAPKENKDLCIKYPDISKFKIFRQ